MNKIMKLSNGIKVICEDMSRLKSVSIGLCCKVGSINEKEHEGISHLVEHMLFKGTNKRSAEEISEELSRVGGEINAFTTKESTVFYITVLDKHIDLALDILSDMIINSSFNEEDLAKEKRIIAEEINMYEDLPDDLIHEANLANVFTNSSLESPILGTIESVNNISRDDIVAFHKKYYVPKNMFLSIAGNIDFNQTIDILEEKFSALTNSNKLEDSTEDIILTNNNKIISKNISQVHLCINAKGTSYLSDDLHTLNVISNIIGSGASSRLFKKVREQEGLAYSIYSYLSSYNKVGLFTTYIGTTLKDYEKVLDIVNSEYTNLLSQGVTIEELDRAKNQIVAGMIFDLESSKTEMFRNMNNYLGNNRALDIDESMEKINNITVDKIVEFSENNFNFENRSFTALGNIL